MALVRKPPVGSTIREGDPLARRLKACFLFNEGAGRPRDLVAGNTLTTVPTWALSKWGKAISITGSTGIAFSNKALLTPPTSGFYPAEGFSAFVLIDGYVDSDVTAVLLDWGDPPAGNIRWQFTLNEYNDTGLLGIARPGYLNVSMAGLTTPTGRGACAWVCLTDSTGRGMRDGLLGSLTDATGFDNGGTGTSYGTIGATGTTDVYKLAALYLWHRPLQNAEMRALFANPWRFIQPPERLEVSTPAAPPAAEGVVITQRRQVRRWR